jgi:hypothetical protein
LFGWSFHSVWSWFSVRLRWPTGGYLVYTVKYNCGEFGKTAAVDVPEGPYAPGFYQTAINVHFPALPPTIDPQNKTPIGFFKKAVLDYAANSTNAPRKEGPFEQPNPYSTPIQASLPPDAGMLIDCQDIRAALLSKLPAGTVAPPAPTFIEGDVVIMVPLAQRSPFGALAPLHVTADYTANSFNCTISSAGGCSPSALARTGITETVQTVTPIQVSNP